VLATVSDGKDARQLMRRAKTGWEKKPLGRHLARWQCDERPKIFRLAFSVVFACVETLGMVNRLPFSSVPQSRLNEFE